MREEDNFFKVIKKDIGYFSYDLYLLAIAVLFNEQYSRLYNLYFFSLIKQDFKQNLILHEGSKLRMKKLKFFFFIPLVIVLVLQSLITHKPFLVNDFLPKVTNFYSEFEYLGYSYLLLLISSWFWLDSFILFHCKLDSRAKLLRDYYLLIGFCFTLISSVCCCVSINSPFSYFTNIALFILSIELLLEKIEENLFFYYPIPLLQCFFLTKIISYTHITGLTLLISSYFFKFD